MPVPLSIRKSLVGRAESGVGGSDIGPLAKKSQEWNFAGPLASDRLLLGTFCPAGAAG